MCKTPNNIYLSNYSFLWAQYFKYEKFLFLFFYKYKFWVVSTKMMFLSHSLMLIFCNYYRLRPYYNNKPVRKKKRAFYDPDGEPRSFNFIRYFDRVFFKRFILKYTKLKMQKLLLKKNISAKRYNRKASRFAWQHLRPLRRWLSQLKEKKLYLFKAKNKPYYVANKVKLNLMHRLKKQGRIKELSLLKKHSKLNKFSFIKFTQRMRPFVYPAVLFLTERKNYTTPFVPKNLLLPKKISKNSKVSPFYYNQKEFNNDNEENKISNNKFLSQYTIEEKSFSFGPIIKFSLISDKLFFFHLKRILKCVFFKKNLDLKLRNIENLIPYKVLRWEDALRTAFLIQFKKKHFIRTIFRDFSYLNKIAYLEMDAQLFAKIIINMFEMTKFHRRLIYLLKSVFETLSRFYRHIHCKIKMKGKMQYKKRTKTIYIFKQVVIPLNRLFINVEYGKGPANTPFGVLGIKTWLYYTQFRYDTRCAKIETLTEVDNYISKGLSSELDQYATIFKKQKIDLEDVKIALLRNGMKGIENYMANIEEKKKLLKFESSTSEKGKKIPWRFITLDKEDIQKIKNKKKQLTRDMVKNVTKYIMKKSNKLLPTKQSISKIAQKKNPNYVKKKN